MDIYEVLKKLNIKYEEVEHQPIRTIEDAKKLSLQIDGVGTKALFLKDKKKSYYLVNLDEDKQADLKEIAQIAGTSRLSFASCDDLEEILGISSGVTPLAIINDIDNKVVVILDKSLRGKKILVHPNTCTKTLSLTHEDLIKVIVEEGHKYIEI